MAAGWPLLSRSCHPIHARFQPPTSNLQPPTFQGRILNTLGILEWQQKEYERALKCYQEGLEIFLELEDLAHQGFEYDGPEEESIRDHARRAGLPADRITRVELEINPQMFV